MESFLRDAEIGDVAAKYKIMPIEGIGIEEKLMVMSFAEMEALVSRFSNGTDALLLIRHVVKYFWL